MKLKPTIVFLCLLLSAGSFFAQVPGYLGRRLTVGYSNNFFVALIGPTRHSYDVGMNTTHCLNAEYTIKNRTNLCMSFQMFNTGLNMNHEFRQYGDDNGTSYVGTYKYAPSPDMPMRISTKSIGLGFKFFRRGTLAPVGKYKKLEMQLLFSHLTYDKTDFTYLRDYGPVAENAQPASLGTGSYSYKTIAFTFTMGRQRVLYDRFVLDYGMQFGFLPVGFFGALNNAIEFSYATEVNTVYRQLINQRLFRYEALNLHIGLGFLAI